MSGFTLIPSGGTWFKSGAGVWCHWCHSNFGPGWFNVNLPGTKIVCRHRKYIFVGCNEWTVLVYSLVSCQKVET